MRPHLPCLILAAAAAGACRPPVVAPPVPPSHSPTPRLGNVTFGSCTIAAMAESDPRIRDELDADPTAAERMRQACQDHLLGPASIGNSLGSIVAEVSAAQLLQSGCSAGSHEVVVQSSGGDQVYGRLAIYRVDDLGTGPAGRGDYFIEVPDAQIAATSGGRTSLAYEAYRTTSGVERYAWVIWLDERPIACP